MRREAETHAEDDRKRRDLIEARNQADNMVYSAEKTLTDLGDKVPGDLKTQVEDAASKVREVKDGDDVEAIKKATEELSNVMQQLGQAAYQQEAEAQAPGETPQGESTPEDKPGEDSDDDEDVVEGEYKQV